MEFCLSCGWFYFVERPVGTSRFELEINGVKATDEELDVINKILKTDLDRKEGNWKQLP